MKIGAISSEALVGKGGEAVSKAWSILTGSILPGAAGLGKGLINAAGPLVSKTAIAGLGVGAVGFGAVAATYGAGARPIANEYRPYIGEQTLPHTTPLESLREWGATGLSYPLAKASALYGVVTANKALPSYTNNVSKHKYNLGASGDMVFAMHNMR